MKSEEEESGLEVWRKSIVTKEEGWQSSDRTVAADLLMWMRFLRSFFRARSEIDEIELFVWPKKEIRLSGQTFFACANSEIRVSCDVTKNLSDVFLWQIHYPPRFPASSRYNQFLSSGKTLADISVDQSVESAKPIAESASDTRNDRFA